MQDEIDSDMSRFHRIRDPLRELDSSRYFRMAELLVSYDGAVRLAFQRILNETTTEHANIAERHGGSRAGEADISVIASMSNQGHLQGMPGIEYEN